LDVYSHFGEEKLNPYIEAEVWLFHIIISYFR
jgi:hypothetical protein